MKTHLKLIAGVALAAISSASAQDNTTKPVGFRTETIKAGVFNLLSADLTEAISAAGTLTGVTATGASDDAADYTTTLAGENKTWVAQLTSGAGEGTVIEVTVNGANGLDSADFLAAGAAAGDSYEVRAAKTLADLFGAANEAGLTGGGSDVPADVIWIPDGQGGFNRFFYKNGGLVGGTGWRAVGALAADRSSFPIVYTDAFFIQSKATQDKDIVLVGHVQTRPATVGLLAGFNFISRIAPVGQTLATTNLAAVVQTAASDAGSDIIWNPDGNGGYNRYFLKTGGLVGGNGWRQVGQLATDASGTPLQSGIIVQRKGAAVNATVGVPAFYADL